MTQYCIKFNIIFNVIQHSPRVTVRVEPDSRIMASESCWELLSGIPL